MKRGTDIANSVDRLNDSQLDWDNGKIRVDTNRQKTDDWFSGDDSPGGLTDNMKTAATLAADAAYGPENTGNLFVIRDAWGQEQEMQQKSDIANETYMDKEKKCLRFLMQDISSKRA